LKKGDKIRITSGPFAEIEGIFVMEDGLHRSMVLIEMMGKQQHITGKQSTRFDKVAIQKPAPRFQY